MRRRLALVATVMWLSAALSVALLTAQSENRDLKSGKIQVRSIVLMPIQISLTKIGMKGSEPMMDEAHDAVLPLSMEIAAALRDLGYQLDMQSLSTEALAKDADERYAVDDLQKKFDAELGLMHRKSKGVRAGRFTLGDVVARLPLSDNVDALLFVRAHGQILTESKRAFGAFVAGARNDVTVMDFGLVGARTGDVLYFGKATVMASLTQDPEAVAAAIAKALVNFPRASLSLAARQNTPLSNADASVSTGSSVPEAPAALLASGNVSDSAAQVRRIRLSHVVLKNLLIQEVAPKYPGLAVANLVQGNVVLRVVINTRGEVANVAVVDGIVQLNQAATDAVKQWRYRPLTVNGQVFEIETQIVVTFKLGP